MTGPTAATEPEVHEKRLSRRHLASFASGIAHQFSSSMEHCVWLARANRCATVSIDLLSQRITPESLDIHRNRRLAEICAETLERNMRQLAPAVEIMAAELVLDLCPQESPDVRPPGSSRPVVVRVVLTDERGKEWRAERREENPLAVP